MMQQEAENKPSGERTSNGVLLSTKLIRPQPRTCLIARPRLTTQLAGDTGGCLTLLSAPAGFGKTTLVMDWAAAHDQPVAWLSLDETDNEPARFWRYLVTALQTAADQAGREMIRWLSADPDPNWEMLISLLINDVGQAATPLSLVLDDYHLIQNNVIHHSLSFLLYHLPSPLHVILLTRADPPLALARLQVQGRVHELRAADLRFTAAEMNAFFDCNLEIPLPPLARQVLADRIEGWPAGLQLAALSLRELPAAEVEPFIQAFSGAQRYVLNYLLEEVLQRLPRRIQTFLLQTCLLRILSPSLCRAVTGYADAHQILQQLAEANLFVTSLDQQGQWYRYHRLFAGALRRRLEQTEPERIPELQRRASDWLEQQGISEASPGHLPPAGTSWHLLGDLPPEIPLADPLTEREWEILILIARGCSNQQIAEQLFITLGTVKGHINHLLSKLDARSRTEAVARALQLGLLKA